MVELESSPFESRREDLQYVMPFSLLQVSVVAEEPDGGGTVT